MFASHNILAATVVSWIVLAGLLVFVRWTRLGRALRAVSMDRKGAVISGIEPHRMNLATWAISGALAALAGVFFATCTQLTPGMWVAPLIIAVAVVVVGGIGSLVGSLVVAHLIGFMETVTTTLVAAELRGGIHDGPRHRRPHHRPEGSVRAGGAVACRWRSRSSDGSRSGS